MHTHTHTHINSYSRRKIHSPLIEFAAGFKLLSTPAFFFSSLNFYPKSINIPSSNQKYYMMLIEILVEALIIIIILFLFK